jgi:hypothetical protein
MALIAIAIASALGGALLGTAIVLGVAKLTIWRNK